MTVALALGASAAMADDVSNTLDATIDSTAESVTLVSQGADGTVTLFVQPRNGDGKNGCNLTGVAPLLKVSVNTSNPAAATVSPSSLTFGSCGDTPAITVTPNAVGTSTITLTQTLNTTTGSFNLAPATFTVNVINTPPTVTVDGVDDGASYDVGAVPDATCEVDDIQDGPSSFPATLSAVGGPYAADGIGSQTASCSYTDAGGLSDTDAKTYSIVDPTAPVIDSDVTGTLGDNGWYVSDVALDWTVTELESPSSLILTGCDDQSITADQGPTDYSCEASSAGGTSGPETVTIKRDASAPAIDCDDAPAGWQADNVSIACTAEDVGPSGLADAVGDAAFSLSTSVADGAEDANAQTDTRSVEDNAGNASVAGPLSAMVDRNAPSMACNGSPTFVQDSSGASVSATATDAGSGPATQTVSQPVSTATVGAHSVTLSASDAVGNEASISCAYSVVYDFSGFFRPIDNKDANGYILNKVKAGSTVPVKFSLHGDRGLDVFAPGYPQTGSIPCPAQATTDAIEEYSTAANNALKYDASADQYVYNWKTQSTWTGCRQLIVKLADGTSHRANFSFTK
ncbi:MAG TPA: PxKF domain-containing protein [Solirubrobacteraceae bacterium]